MKKILMFGFRDLGEIMKIAAAAERCGAANTRNAVYPASASSTPRRKFQLRFITQPSASIYM